MHPFQRLTMYAVATLAPLGLWACSQDSGPRSSPPDAALDVAGGGTPDASPDATRLDAALSEVVFPEGFHWGSATAAFQIESGNHNTDWGTWVTMPGRIARGDSPDRGGPDALNHIDEDVAILADSGQNAYRFSIELGRIYPTREAFDRDMPDGAAWARYEELITKLRARNIVPMVTLHHFSSPSYLSDPTRSAEPQAWERPEMETVFVEFARRMAARLGDRVDHWITINEPLNLALGGYIQGGFPPGLLLDMTRALSVIKAETRAHAKAYDAIHAADTVDADGDGQASWVSMAFHMRTFHPYDKDSADDIEAAARVARIWNRFQLDALVHGNWDDDFDGTFDGPSDVKADPTLRKRVDFVGVNYYSDTLISATRGIRLPVLEASVFQDYLPTGRPRTEFGWDIYPEGLGTVLDVAAEYKLPIFITENGLADSTDANRERYLLEHLYQVGLAIARGADVRGYYHWSLLDNFEWNSGFCPKFGFVAYDQTTKSRTPRRSLDAYKRLISDGRLAWSRVDGAQKYTQGAYCLP